MSHKLFSGLVAAPYTPFDGDGTLNAVEIPRQVKALHQRGVSGAFICGTTGEGSSLTLAERKRVAEEWIRNRPANFNVIVHVGHNCLVDAADLARHAESAGADAIGMIAPSFFRPVGLDVLVASCAQVARAAPSLPFYYYHMPVMTGVDFSMAAFLESAGRQIPNLGGVKFTHENLMDFGKALAVAPDRYTVFHGRDEILLAGLSLGASAAVGSTYNYLMPIFRRLLAAFSAGDLVQARSEQAAAVRFMDIIFSYGGVAGGKAVMKLLGLDCGEVRLPLRGLGQSGHAKLKAELEQAGFFEMIKPFD